MLPPGISTSLQEFSLRLQSSLPLRHHWEYVEADTFNVKACVESSVAFQKLRNNVLKTAIGKEKDKLAETFRLEVEKLIEGHRKKNEDLKIQAYSVLKKRRDDLCGDFETTIERKLQLDSNINLKSIEEFLEAGKELMKSYFKYHSNSSSIPGNGGAFNKVQINEEKVLMQELERIGNVLLGQRRGNLESGSEQEGKTLMEEGTRFLLKKRMEELCVEFKSTIQTKLLISPEMNLTSLKHLLETGKGLAKSYFEYHSNFRNNGRYNEDQIIEEELEQELNRLGIEIRKEQSRYLKSIAYEKAKILLEKLKVSVQEMAEKVKADSRKWTKRKYELNLKERIEEIRNYVNENSGSVLSEGNYRELFKELLQLESGGEMSAEEFIEWAEGLNKEVKHDIVSEVERSDMFLVQDGEVDAPVADLGQDAPIVEKDDESRDLETPQEMDMDIKIELDGMVVHTSLIKPGLVEKRSHNQNLEAENRSAENDIHSSYKRQKLSEPQTPVGIPAMDEDIISSPGKGGEDSGIDGGRRLPLTQLCQLYENAQLCDASGLENENILAKFVEANPNISLDFLKERLQKIIDDLAKKTEDLEPQSESFLRKQVELACETSEATFDTNPDGVLMSVKGFPENGKIRTMQSLEDTRDVESVRILDKFVHNIILDSATVVINEYRSSNAHHRILTESSIKIEIDRECDKFKTSLKAKLEDNPVMDLKTVEELVESGKLIVASYFEYHWNCGNVDFKEQKKNLKEKLDHLGQEVLKTQIENLKEKLDHLGQEVLKTEKENLEKKLSKFLEALVLNASEELKCDVNATKLTEVIIGMHSDLLSFTSANDVILLIAIREGQSIARIKRLLDDGVNVNIKTESKINAAHCVMMSLKDQKLSMHEALEILDLLVSRGFNLINEAYHSGYTPLHVALSIGDVSENLLTWFHQNGADFNAVVRTSFEMPMSVLYLAIQFGKDKYVLRKIVELGGVSTPGWKNNALHISAMYHNFSALEFFLDTLDVTEKDDFGCTPLHYLFLLGKPEQHCLELLLKKGADPMAKNKNGDVPLVAWVKRFIPLLDLLHCSKAYEVNHFSALLAMKDALLITKEVASSALTAIVNRVLYLKSYLTLENFSQGPHNACSNFITFLIEEKDAKVQLPTKSRLESEHCIYLENVILPQKFSEELKKSGRLNWEGEGDFSNITGNHPGQLDFHAKSSIVTIPVELVMVCLLECKRYTTFIILCEFLRRFF